MAKFQAKTRQTMENSLTDKDLTTRRGEISSYGRSVNASRSLKVLLSVWVILCAVILVMVAIVMPQVMPQGGVVSRITVATAVAAILIGGRYIWNYTHTHFIEPELAFRKWLQDICDGELDATIGLSPSHDHYKELDFHSRNISSALNQLTTDMETLVEKQTNRLENQNRVLELLFHLTSDVAGEIDQSSVLNTVCTYLRNWLGDAHTAAYMVDKDQLKLSAASHDSEFPAEIGIDALVDSISYESVEQQESSRVKIPFFKAGEPVGYIQAIYSHNDEFDDKESRQVFKSVSEQLSTFVAKHAALESAHQSRLLNERTQFGAEIHDSLAQTLLASRYRLSALRETIKSNPAADIYSDVLRIEGTIKEANIDVRELIATYREIPQDHRWVDSLQSVIDKFTTSSEIPIFFQCDNPQINFTAREYSTVERIVGEALFNAIKYSQASMIRVYLRVEDSGVRSILIEDDGIGFSNDAVHNDNAGANTGCKADPKADPKADLGDHIGLSIMRDRAITIGAMLTIDSEPGEGTRVNLKLRPFVLLDE